MSSWEDSYDIGGDGVPDDFDSVADFDTGPTDGLDGVTLDGASVADADAWIVDLDLGGLADVADIALVAGVEDLAATVDDTHDGAPPIAGDHPALPPLLAHDLSRVPDGADPFAALAGRRLDDAELRNEIRHLRITPPFGSPPTDSPMADAATES